MVELRSRLLWVDVAAALSGNRARSCSVLKSWRRFSWSATRFSARQQWNSVKKQRGLDVDQSFGGWNDRMTERLPTKVAAHRVG